MRWIASLLVAIGLVIPIVFFPPSRVGACSCGDLPSVADELSVSGLVFRGIVTSIDFDEDRSYLEIDFDVLTVWKGAIVKKAVVFTGHGGGDCGYHFMEGGEYLVYASEEAPWVGICGRTAPFAVGVSDLRELGPGTEIDYGGNPPTPYDPADRTPIGQKTWIIPVVAALIASIVGLAWFVTKRLAPRLS